MRKNGDIRAPIRQANEQVYYAGFRLLIVTLHGRGNLYSRWG